jgi:hypothetical protein
LIGILGTKRLISSKHDAFLLYFISLTQFAMPTKPTRIAFGLVVAAAVVSVGYIITLAVLAPEQLAEAQAAATDLVCDKCVGTTDIADNAVTSGKIASGQVKSGDIATSAVSSAKILDSGVTNFDIANGQVWSEDIKDDSVTASDIAPGAVGITTRIVTQVSPAVDTGQLTEAIAYCDKGEVLTGGGIDPVSRHEYIQHSKPTDDGSGWAAKIEANAGSFRSGVTSYALCTSVTS